MAGRSWRGSLPSFALFGMVLAADPAAAVERSKVTSVDCEQFFLWKRTPVVHYDIADENVVDYRRNPGADYFAQAAERTAAYCDRTSKGPQQALGPQRRIRGVWFQSNDERFRAMYSLDQNGVDGSAGIVNRIGDAYAAEQLATAQHQARLDEVRTGEARAQDLEAARRRAEQDRADARSAREQAFYARADLQRARLGATVTPANFATLRDLRTNPFHYRRLGLAVVRASFNRMVTEDVALFGDELAPLLVRMADPDRFTRAGEVVMLALRVTERGEVERSYGSVPEAIISSLRQEPVYGTYVGAFTCPAGDCDRVFDATPPA